MVWVPRSSETAHDIHGLVQYLLSDGCPYLRWCAQNCLIMQQSDPTTPQEAGRKAVYNLRIFFWGGMSVVPQTATVFDHQLWHLVTRWNLRLTFLLVAELGYR